VKLTLIGILLLGSLVSTSIGAQKPDPLQKLTVARDILRLANDEDAFAAILDKLSESTSATQLPFLAQVVNHEPTPDDLAKLRKAIRESLNVSLPMRDIQEAVAPIYTQALSLEELIAWRAFLQSPLGQRVGQIQHQVLRSGEALAQQVMKTNDEAFRKALVDALRKAFPE